MSCVNFIASDIKFFDPTFLYGYETNPYFTAIHDSKNYTNKKHIYDIEFNNNEEEIKNFINGSTPESVVDKKIAKK